MPPSKHSKYFMQRGVINPYSGVITDKALKAALDKKTRKKVVEKLKAKNILGNKNNILIKEAEIDSRVESIFEETKFRKALNMNRSKDDQKSEDRTKQS